MTRANCYSALMQETGGRVNQKRRTYNAILQAALELIRTERAVTMPEVARAALVSEATAYRYFPDLITLVRAAMDGQLLTPDEALASVSDSTDPVARVAAVTERLLRHVLAFQPAVRAMISAAVAHPDDQPTARPVLRFGLIDAALAPVADSTDESVLAQLKRDLTIVVSAEALFSLTDLCGLGPDDAIASIVHTATTLTRAALDPPASRVARRVR